jgi:hypothetical protein
MSVAATCGVCDNKLRGTSTRAPVVCPDPECEFVACRACARRYAVEGGAPRPACMAVGCSVEYREGDLAGLLGHTWVNTAYRRHRALQLLRGELALLPDAMNDIPGYLAAEEAARAEAEVKAEVARARGVLKDARARHAAARRKSAAAREPWDGARAQHQYPCPRGDCRGFVGSGWRCCVCGGKTCAACLSPESEGHVCDEDAVASAAVVRTVAKACPGCACPIERASGCPQMYCTRCGCRWDWNTHRIHTRGTFHNPHLMEDSIAGRANRGGQSLTFAQVRLANSTIRQALHPIVRAGNVADAPVPLSVQRFVSLLLSHASSIGDRGPDDVRLLSVRLAARSRLGQMNKLVGKAAWQGRVVGRFHTPHAVQTARRRKRVEYALGRLSREDYRKWLQKNELEGDLNTEAGLLLQRLSRTLSWGLERAYESLEARQRWTDAVIRAIEGDESDLTVQVDELSEQMGAAQQAVDSYNQASSLLSARLGRSTLCVRLDTYEIKPQRTTQAQAAALSQASAIAGAAESLPSPA